MSFAPANHANYVTERLIEFVKATVEKAKSLVDVDGTASPATPTMLNVPKIVAEFMMIVRALCPASRVDDVFAEFHRCIRNLPEEMRLKEDELRAFVVEYSVTTRVTRVKGDEQEFQVWMAKYEKGRQVVKDLENVLMKTHANDILEQLLEAQINLQEVRKHLDCFAEYRVETLQERALCTFSMLYRAS